MIALTNALAALVALEARAAELVDPVESIGTALKAVVKEAVVVVSQLHEHRDQVEQQLAEITHRLEALEAHMAAVTEAPAIASDVKPFRLVAEAAPSAPVEKPEVVALEVQGTTNSDPVPGTTASTAPDATIRVATQPAEGSGT